MTRHDQLARSAPRANDRRGPCAHRLGGRIGLIEAVIEEVVATELRPIVDHARTIEDTGERLTYYVTAIRDLQYRQPAFADVMLEAYPDAPSLVGLCHVAGAFNKELVEAGRASRVLRSEFTADDLHALLRDNALALKHGIRPRRKDYDRCTMFCLEGIRA